MKEKPILRDDSIQSDCHDIILQVLICTFGKDGINRIAKSSHPVADGVEYLISWQTDTDYPIPPELERDDFKIHTTFTKGLSVNRNIALSKATAPLLLISDDDVDYSSEGLAAIIESFKSNPEADIIAFMYDCTTSTKTYPSELIDLGNPPKGYYISSIEIALRRESVQDKIWFNENFGIGATFPSGEEDLFIKDCLDAGLKGIFLPITIAKHDGTTTSDRNLMLASRPQTKGAVFLRLHPWSWPLRMLAHARREYPLWRQGLAPSPLSYCRNWIKGVIKAQKIHAFPTYDYSRNYLK